jgi:hypothetical protein
VAFLLEVLGLAGTLGSEPLARKSGGDLGTKSSFQLAVLRLPLEERAELSPLFFLGLALRLAAVVLRLGIGNSMIGSTSSGTGSGRGKTAETSRFVIRERGSAVPEPSWKRVLASVAISTAQRTARAVTGPSGSSEAYQSASIVFERKDRISPPKPETSWTTCVGVGVDGRGRGGGARCEPEEAV